MLTLAAVIFLIIVAIPWVISVVAISFMTFGSAIGMCHALIKRIFPPRDIRPLDDYLSGLNE